MASKLYVGKLAYETTEETLKNEFAKHGNVTSVQLILDRDSGRSKGFGFVEMASDEEAQAAIKALDGKEFEGRTIVVNVARPKEDRSSGGYRS